MMRGRKYRDVTIRGVTYADVAAVCAALGVTRNTVTQAICAGTLETVGLGQGYKSRQPVAIRGVIYPDAYAAAQALGVSVTAVYQGLHRNQPDKIGLRKLGGLLPGNAKPVRIGPLRFPSQAAAARALGFCESHVGHVLSRGTATQREALLAAAMRMERAQVRARGARS